MVKVYDLKARIGFRASTFLCNSVEGFEYLWEDYVGTPLRGYNLERFLVLTKRVKPIEGFEIAADIRKEVKSMLPCSITVKDFEAIVNKHIDKYFEE